MDKNHELNIEKRSRWYECYISINDVVHRIYYKTTLDGMFYLYVDDKCVMSKKEWFAKLMGFDYALEIDGETLHCVFTEKKLDVAMYGRYIKGQETYIPIKVLHRVHSAVFAILFAVTAIICLYGWEVIRLTQKEVTGLLVFLVIIMLGFLGYQDNYIKKAKKEQKLIEDTHYKEPKG